jgi:hypothetical protein
MHGRVVDDFPGMAACAVRAVHQRPPTAPHRPCAPPPARPPSPVGYKNITINVATQEGFLSEESQTLIALCSRNNYGNFSEVVRAVVRHPHVLCARPAFGGFCCTLPVYVPRCATRMLCAKEGEVGHIACSPPPIPVGTGLFLRLPLPLHLPPLPAPVRPPRPPMQCLPCPQGAYCDGELAEPVALPGWFKLQGKGPAECPPERLARPFCDYVVRCGARRPWALCSCPSTGRPAPSPRPPRPPRPPSSRRAALCHAWGARQDATVARAGRWG